MYPRIEIRNCGITLKACVSQDQVRPTFLHYFFGSVTLVVGVERTQGSAADVSQAIAVNLPDTCCL